ncbi:tetratricopeptide repeat protein [Desulfurivibrio sp. D14AmB]|uniref:surface lipoprotein assembly modifier n=1 Tax=Desulfurivibrio sp. D14AmB TaxID=3374370 RepID=UPI00376F08B7
MPRKPSLLIALILAAGCLCWSGPAAAAEDPLLAGRQALAAGDFDTAYRSFFALFEQNPAHPEVNFQLGRAAFESGRYEEAVMAYERVLMANPEAARAKLELARSYLKLDSNEIARRYFQEVLATNPPEAIWQNVQRFLAAIEAAEKRHFINGLFTVGAGYDDNVRAAPHDFVYIVPLSFDRESDSLLNTNLVLNHVYRPRYSSPWSWKTSLTNYNVFHESVNDMDLNLYGLGTGPSWRRERLLLQGSLNFHHIDLGYDRYLGIMGAGAAATWIASPRWAVSGGLTVQERKYHQDSAKDATNVAVNLGPVFSLGPNRLGLTAGYEKENAELGLHSYDRWRLTLRYDRRLPWELAFFAVARLTETDYEDPHPLFAKTREDESLYLNFGFSRVLWRSADSRRGLSGQLAYARTDTDSSIPIYEYTKNVYDLALTYTF